jgi:hypothetical protein
VALSNAVRFDVHAPAGEDVQVLTAIENDLGMLQCDYPGGPKKTKALLARFPNSPYLRWASIACLKWDHHELYSGYRDPETGKIIGAQDTEKIRLVAKKLLQKVLSLGDLGPFEVERLDLGYTLAVLTGDETAASLKMDLLSRFPESVAAVDLRKSEADDLDER